MRLSVLAGTLALLAACASSFEQHQALWAAKGPASYRYTYSTTGFVGRLEVRVHVEGGVVTDATVISPAGLPGPIRGQTVEQLFADVRSRLDGPCKTTARYDETLGYPLSAYSDCGGEGDGWIVQDFGVDGAPDGGVR